MRTCGRDNRLHLVLFFAVLISPLPAQQASKDGFGPLDFLLGDWVAEGGGAPGQGTGGFSFAPDLQRAIVVRKSYAEYPATKDRPTYRHDDLMVIYKDSSAHRKKSTP